jgi:dihydroorotase
MVDVVIRGARVWSELGIRVADVALEAGEIVDVGSVPRGAGSEFDATGLLLLPGLIDDHVHFREPGREDKEDFATGSQAAAHGGVTTIIEIQNNAPLMTSRAAVEAKLALVRPKSRVNVGIYGSATAASLGKLGEMADYVLGYKIFLAPSHGDAGVDSDEMLRSLYREAARAGRPVVVHAEDKATIEKGLAQFSTDGPRGWSRARSPAAEVLAVERALRLCEETGARTHVFHLSAAGSVDRLADAKAKGLPVTGATCPHYLLFTDDDVARVGGLLKVNPSIKGAVDRARLREGIRDGTIDVLETDHAPHLPTEKTAPFNDNPSGISSVDVFLPVLLKLVADGVLTLDQVIERACRAPARLFGIANKGSIARGFDADLVLIDDRTPWSPRSDEFLSKANLSPYVDYAFPARVVRTYVGGRVAFGA